MRQRRKFGPATSTAPNTGPAAANALPCFGTGTDGDRVQAVYARQAGTADNSPALYSSIVSWAANVDTVLKESATKTGGVRHARFVTDSGCNLVVASTQISAAAVSNFGTFVSEMKANGFNRADRKYLVWTDANTYCGIAEIYSDDSANSVPNLGSSNASNGNLQVDGTLGRIDNACWGMANPVEAHELVHTLGGVQHSAPHATQGFHCTDGADRMCYLDGTPPGFLTQTCPPADASHLDCNNDDYFSTAPPAGTYLATHWNVANSAFLDSSAGEVVVAIAGDAATERLMAQLAAAMDNSALTIGGNLQRARVINIPTFSASS